jgi:hypothetical protein
MAFMQYIPQSCPPKKSSFNHTAIISINYTTRMDFGLDKCAKIVLKRGKLVHSQNLILNFNIEIQEFEQVKTYKYSGIQQSEGMQHQQMAERLKEEYTRRLRMMLKSKLNAKKKMEHYLFQY